MRRREFITLLGGAAAWPIMARAQQPERVRRIGVLMGYPEGDPQAQANVTALRQGLREVGWTKGRNVQIDYRWAGGDPDKARTLAKELIGMMQEVIVPTPNRATIFGFPVAAREGSLVAYGPDYLHMYRRAPLYVERVLKGTRPADLPVEQPTKVEFLINLKTAKTLGLEPPLS